MNAFFALCQREAPGAEPLRRVVVGGAGDAGSLDPGVDGFGECAVFDEPSRLAGIIREPLPLPRRLDAAVVHLKDDALRALVKNRLDIDPRVKAEAKRPLQAGEPRRLRKVEEPSDRPGLERGKPCPTGVVAALGVPDPVAGLDRLEPDPVAGDPVSPQITEQAEEFFLAFW